MYVDDPSEAKTNTIGSLPTVSTGKLKIENTMVCCFPPQFSQSSSEPERRSQRVDLLPLGKHFAIGDIKPRAPREVAPKVGYLYIDGGCACLLSVVSDTGDVVPIFWFMPV